MTQKPGGGPRMIYSGSFDLAFLAPGETVASTGGDGGCWITQPTGPGAADGHRIKIGQTVERLPTGELIVYGVPSDSARRGVPTSKSAGLLDTGDVLSDGAIVSRVLGTGDEWVKVQVDVPARTETRLFQLTEVLG